jgi:starch-binding outer membrane protein, SusD/RagB family
MNPTTRGRATTLLSLAMVAGLVVLAANCSPDDLLSVEDPDIINPSNVQSSAGAEAVRLGALSRFNGATSGATGQDESLFLLGGLFSDELINGDSYIARQEIDQRVITAENTFLTAANRQLHRARLSAQQAVELIRQYNLSAPGWHVGEMFMIQAYTINLMAEHLCDGLIISDVVDGREVYGEPMTTAAAFERALGLANEGLVTITANTSNDARVRNALALVKGRILVNLNRHAEAATAVAAIPANWQYVNYQTQTTWSNVWWMLMVNARRYSVGDVEGINGMNFASANDPRVPVCAGNDAQCKTIGVTNPRRDDLGTPFLVLMKWPTREGTIAIMQGVDARMIEAEAQLKAGNPGASLATLNVARDVIGMADLADAGTPEARLSQLFRERAFWQYGRGYRVGDLRRLIRQYGRTENTVFPTGAWHKGGNYGTDVDMPVPQAEQNNPNLGVTTQTCMSRGA